MIEFLSSEAGHQNAPSMGCCSGPLCRVLEPTVAPTSQTVCPALVELLCHSAVQRAVAELNQAAQLCEGIQPCLCCFYSLCLPNPAGRNNKAARQHQSSDSVDSDRRPDVPTRQSRLARRLAGRLAGRHSLCTASFLTSDNSGSTQASRVSQSRVSLERQETVGCEKRREEVQKKKKKKSATV